MIGASGRLLDDEKPVAGLSDAVIPLVANDDGTPTVTVDPESGAVTVEHDDGSVVIDFTPDKYTEASDDFDQNLADILDDDELNSIASDLLEGIEADLTSRKQWESNLADSMAQLGLQKEVRSNLDLDTISKCRHPLLLECCLDYWANAVAEFLPSDGPVKVRVDDEDAPELQDESDRLEQDFNHYLTVTASEYYPDTSRGLFRVGFIGGIVKKIFRCALRQRPVSESVYLEDLIVSNDATDLQNAKRVTQRMMYLGQDVKAMQVAGVWRDVSLGTPQDNSDSLAKTKVAEIQGTTPFSDREDDKQHTIYECHTKRIIDKDPKAKKMVEDGLPVPYKITLDKDGVKVLAIYRLWKDGDKLFRKRQQYVPWFYAPGLGWYPIGLAQILGNDTTTLTALWREMVDAGMFNNFPGFLYLDALGRQDTNRFKIPPAGGQPIKAPPGMSIQNSVMPLPYKEVSSTLLAFAKQIEDAARKKAGAAKIPIGEGVTDIPVGSLLMFVEQSTKMLQAVHKGLHTAQAREFELLKELFVEDPESLTKFNDDPDQQGWTAEQLKNHNLAPASDPNTPSHVHRISMALALFMMAQQAPPGLFSNHEIADRIFKVLHISDPESLFAPPAPPTPPQAPPPDPTKMAAIQQKEQTEQRKAANEAVQAQQDQKKTEIQAQMDTDEMQSKEKIAAMEQQTERLRLQAQEQQSVRDQHTHITTNAHKLAVDLAKQHLSNQAKAVDLSGSPV